MSIITRAMTPEETQAAIAYFTKLPRKQWVTVVETDLVPKTRIVEGNLRIPLEPEQVEPLGPRIVEVPKYPMRTRNYDSHAPFVAFVPQSGARWGKTTELMKPIAAQLTLQQMIDAAAYLGSKTP